MSKKLNFEKINTITRLFSYHSNGSNSAHEVMSKVESKLNVSYAPEIEVTKNVFGLSSKTTNKSIGLNPEKSLFFSLKSDVSAAEGDSEKVLSLASYQISRTSKGFLACSRFYNSIYVYPVIIIFIAMIVYTMYQQFFLPTMQNVFTDLAEMPDLTRLIFSDVIAIALWMFFLIVVIFFIRNTVVLQQKISLYQPVKGWFSKTFFSGDNQRYLLFLMYLKVMLDCGSNAQKSLYKAQEYVDIKSDQYFNTYRSYQDALKATVDEGEFIFGLEVDHQIENVTDGMQEKLIIKQESLLFIFQGVVFCLVGLLVLSMYLPIFKIASVF